MFFIIIVSTPSLPLGLKRMEDEARLYVCGFILFTLSFVQQGSAKVDDIDSLHERNCQ